MPSSAKGIKIPGSDKLRNEKCPCRFLEPEPNISNTTDIEVQAPALATSGDHDFYFDLDTTAQLANASCPLKSPDARRTGPDAPGDNYYTPGSVEPAIEYFCNEYANKDDIVRISDLFLVATPQDDYPEHRVPTWISARNWTDHPNRHECDKTSLMANHTLQASECNLALKQANFACSGDNADLTRGGSRRGYCLAYEIVTSETYNRDYRLLEAENTGGFLEAWSGGSNAKRNGTAPRVFKGKQDVVVGCGQAEATGDKGAQE